MENISTSLRRLHMSGMSMCWKTMTETHQADKLTFRDGLEILIQSEMDTQLNLISFGVLRVQVLHCLGQLFF